jgi:signal transduction histidine kinase
LGLSLTYDIVKAHGGTIVVNSFNSLQGVPEDHPQVAPPGEELKVETATAKKGRGSEFIIELPDSL